MDIYFSQTTSRNAHDLFSLVLLPSYRVNNLHFSKAGRIDGAVSSVQQAVQTAVQKRFPIFDFLETTGEEDAAIAITSGGIS